jgi:hypothetical protein
MKSPKTIKELFCFPGFTANARLRGAFGDKYARVVTLRRRKKQPSVRSAAIAVRGAMTNRRDVFAISPWPVTGCIWSLSSGESIARSVKACT